MCWRGSTPQMFPHTDIPGVFWACSLHCCMIRNSSLGRSMMLIPCPTKGWMRQSCRWLSSEPSWKALESRQTRGQYGRIWKDMEGWHTLAVIIFHQYSFPKRPCFHMISQLANCLMVVMTCASRPTDYQEGPGHDITVIVSTSRKQCEPGRSLHIATVITTFSNWFIFIDFHWLYEFRKCSKILRSHVKIDMALQVEVGSEIHDLLAGVPPQSSVTIVMDRLRYHVRHVRVLKLGLKKNNMILLLFNPIYIYLYYLYLMHGWMRPKFLDRILCLRLSPSSEVGAEVATPQRPMEVIVPGKT